MLSSFREERRGLDWPGDVNTLVSPGLQRIGESYKT